MSTTAPSVLTSAASALIRDLAKNRWRNGEATPPILDIPGDRATLARCLGRPFSDLSWLQAERFVSPHLPAGADTATEQAFFLVAAMVCGQSPRGRALDTGRDRVSSSDDPSAGSLGRAMAIAVVHRRLLDDKGAEGRLLQLASQDTAGLHRRLPTLVKFLRDGRTPLSWEQLIVDLAQWRYGRNETARSWMRDYHRTRLNLEANKRRKDKISDSPESENR
ncbi:type I-E CRISPR-associated protein Cse2/CasB [Phytomonospora endophytica]|uniref:CRISPR system Cascade subunit CasB n=1 Tax=Phytomonospora endophytica TaxID=714109 RepID=A0A841G1R0_9ACTN|nr:type I-E CRISPR-associated protein Cse2/CasB [Phytomonospora endophytica]MBB6039587.1 CRISPR system Cascade subunit CasB [Phytomonospora endophytica]GIG70552.1 hypothetical protein Pen01_68470 [Phytomonospora endophytica]